ncbi:MAG: flippase-like domain-containing protein [Ignavibacteriales bacterium]|nr:flippase-like domain-containing protein [Ignavibacteriales bacterium]
MALADPARRAACPRADWAAAQLVPGRDLLQQLPAQQHRGRCHPDPRHRGSGRFEDARHHRRADGPRDSACWACWRIAAAGSSIASRIGGRPPMLASMLWLALGAGIAASAAAVLLPGGVARLLSPLRLIHQEWVEERIGRLTAALTKFRNAPGALATCLLGAVVVQAVLVAFYAAIVHSMSIPVSAWHLAVIVPISFVVQMAPVSLNGFGVREATFTFYFSRIGLPIESALVVSFMGAGAHHPLLALRRCRVPAQGPRRAEFPAVPGTASGTGNAP